MKKISNIENVRNHYGNSNNSVYQNFRNKIFHDPLNCPKTSSDDKSSKYENADPINKGGEGEREKDLKDCNKYDLAVLGATYVELAYKYFTGRNINIFPCVDAFCTCSRDSPRSDDIGTSEEILEHKTESIEDFHDIVEYEGHDSGDGCEGQYKRTESSTFVDLPVYLPPIRSMLHKELDYKPHNERYTETPAHRFLLPYVSMVRKAVQKTAADGMNVLENFIVRRGGASPGQWPSVRTRDQVLKSNEVFLEPRNVMVATLGGGAGYALASYRAKWPSNSLYRKLLYTSGGGALAAVTFHRLYKWTESSNSKMKRVRR